MSITGPSKDKEQILVALCDEVVKLTQPIPLVELERAKNILKINILMAMEKKEDRTEEIARNLMTYKKLTFVDYCKRIDEVTSDKVNEALKKAIKKQPTLVAIGENADQIPNVSQVYSYLQRYVK